MLLRIAWSSFRISRSSCNISFKTNLITLLSPNPVLFIGHLSCYTTPGSIRSVFLTHPQLLLHDLHPEYWYPIYKCYFEEIRVLFPMRLPLFLLQSMPFSHFYKWTYYFPLSLFHLSCVIFCTFILTKCVKYSNIRSANNIYYKYSTHIDFRKILRNLYSLLYIKFCECQYLLRKILRYSNGTIRTNKRSCQRKGLFY